VEGELGRLGAVVSWLLFFLVLTWRRNGIVENEAGLTHFSGLSSVVSDFDCDLDGCELIEVSVSCSGVQGFRG
jgi:hypothetical protein